MDPEVDGPVRRPSHSLAARLCDFPATACKGWVNGLGREDLILVRKARRNMSNGTTSNPWVRIADVLLRQPVRQWVLSLPFALRYLLATRPEVVA